MAELNPFLESFLQAARDDYASRRQREQLAQQESQFGRGLSLSKDEFENKKKKEANEEFWRRVAASQQGILPAEGDKPGVSGPEPYSAPASGDPGVPQVGPLGRTQPEPQLTNPPTTGFDVGKTTLPSPGGPPVQADSINPLAAYFKNFMGPQSQAGPPVGADTLGQPTPGIRINPTQSGAANEMVGQGAGQGAGGGAIAPMAPFLPQQQQFSQMRDPSGTMFNIPKPVQKPSMRVKITKYLEKEGFGKEGDFVDIPGEVVPNVLPTIFGGQNQQIAAEVKGEKPAKAPVINQQIMDSVVAMAAADPANQKAFNDARVNPKEVSDLSDLPLSLQEGAIMKYGRLQPNADVANTMKLAISALDSGRNRELNDKQVLAGQKAQLVIQHPEAYFHIKDPEEQRIVEKSILNQGGKIPINEPTGQDKIALGQANRVFDSLSNIRRLTKALGPQSTGAIAGRWSEAEGRWGTPVFDKDPQRASVEAQLRSEMTYLMGQELKTIFTGRPAVQMLNMMKNVSPSMKQYYAMLDGSMNGMEEMAASAVHSSRDRMFDEHTKFRHRTSNQPDPQTGLPRHQYSWDGGKTWLPQQ